MRNTCKITIIFSENIRLHKWFDIFEVLWNDHIETVQQQICKFFQFVPIKNGYPAIGWFTSYGDCNMRIKRTICHFPRHLATLQRRITPKNSIDTNLGKCKNSPLKANQHTKQYNCCLEHSYMLQQYQVPLDDINDFCWYFNGIDILSKTKSENVKRKWNGIINRIPASKQSQFQEFNRNICNLLSTKSDENEIHVSKIETIMIDESINDTTIDDLRSCRKGENIAKSQFGTSAGTMCFMNCTGAIIFLAEVPVRETPTFVLHQLYQSFTKNKDLIQYYQRMECLGILYTIIFVACFQT